MFEGARATQGPDLGQAPYRTLVDEEVRHHLPVGAPVREPLAHPRRRVLGRLDDLEMVAPAELLLGGMFAEAQGRAHHANE